MSVELLRKKERVRKAHIYVLLSHTFEMITSQFFDFMLKLHTNYSLSVLRGNALPLDANRTGLVDIALKDPNMTHCLFIDTDIIPEDPNFLDRMMSYDLPIIGALCTKKTPPYEPVLIKLGASPEEKTGDFYTKFPRGLVEVDATGTGCLLVKREVFQNISKPYFRFLNNYTHGLHQSEDIYFITQAKAAGYTVHVDTDLQCTHYGMYGFGMQDFMRERPEQGYTL